MNRNYHVRGEPGTKATLPPSYLALHAPSTNTGLFPELDLAHMLRVVGLDELRARL